MRGVGMRKIFPRFPDNCGQALQNPDAFISKLLLLLILLLIPAHDLFASSGGKSFAIGSPATNLIPNPKFSGSGGENGKTTASTPRLPSGWSIGAGGKLRDSRFWLPPSDDPPNQAIGITGGRDRQGIWTTSLPACKPGTTYRFEAEFYRPDLKVPYAYPEVRIWGKSFKLNTHCTAGRFQLLHVDVTCPKGRNDRSFSFINMNPGVSFWMRSPILKKKKKSSMSRQVPPQIDYFPIGIYGATAANLSQIKEMGFNSPVIELSTTNVSACLAEKLHCTLSVPRDPNKLAGRLDLVEPLIKQGHFSFYVNDEPGIHSFPAEKAHTIQRLLKSRFPMSFTNMAIVRPQVIPDYQQGADYFMLDQYPVPNMPLIWLSDSMDKAAAFVGRNRLQSVIQAFGGPEFTKDGWPRVPTFEEMDCLAFLSIIHGSRGVYFFSYPYITSTGTGQNDLKRVVRRLNSLESWLQQENDPAVPKITIQSRYGFDPSGRPAIHCASKQQYGTRMLLCVNTIRNPVETEVTTPWKDIRTWREYFSGEAYFSAEGIVHLRFSPLEVKVLLEAM